MFFLTLMTVLDPINGDLLDKLMTEHQNRLYSMALQILRNSGKGTEEDAADLVQDTFLKVYRNINRFSGLSDTDTIRLLTIYTKYTVFDFLKRAEHRYGKVPLVYEEDEEEKTLDLPDDAPGPEEILLNKETLEELAEYIDRLTDKQRHVVLLKYQYGYRNKEIAKLIQVPVTNVSSLLERAGKALHKMKEEAEG